MEVKTVSKDYKNEQTDVLKDDLTTDAIRQMAQKEKDKAFSTFESNRREKAKAEEMMPESFEDSGATSTDDETT